MDNVRTPYFCIDADRLESNLRILRGVMDRTGCKILLAQKCFSCYGLYPLVSEYLAGATASGIFEARLWHEEGSGENHVFFPFVFRFRHGEGKKMFKVKITQIL